MKLPSEWAPCPGIEGVEIMLSGGALLFRQGGQFITAWWVRPLGVKTTTGVVAFTPQGGQVRLGGARSFPRARDLVKAHLDRSKEA